MDLKDCAEQMAEVIKETKTKWVATKPENTDIAIYVHFYRNDQLVAVAQCPVDRDQALNAARMGIIGFGADVVSISFESFWSSHRESPVSGKPWVPREMQYVFETYPQAISEGWVDECISIMVVNRDEQHVMKSMPYRINDAQQVEWKDEELFSSDQGGAAGVMYEAIASAMRLPTIAEHIALEAEQNPVAAALNGMVTDQEEREFHTDMATCRSMEERQLVTEVMISAQPGSKREQMLADRLGEPDSRGIYPDV